MTRLALGPDDTVESTSETLVCLGPQGMTVAFDRVWVACTADGSVTALDPSSGKVLATVPDIPKADAVLSVGDSIVTVSDVGPTAYVIDPATARVSRSFPLDSTPGAADGNVDAVVIGATLWVTHPTPGRLYSLPVAEVG